MAIVGDAGDVPRSLKFFLTMTAVSDHEGEMERWFPAKNDLHFSCLLSSEIYRV